MGDIGPLSALAALRHLALRALASKPDACWEVRTRSKLHPLGVSLHWALWPACTSVEAGGAVGLAMQVDACCEVRTRSMLVILLSYILTALYMVACLD